MKQILIFIFVFLVPLIPSLMLNRFLGKRWQPSKASVVRRGIKASGPFAAYLLLVPLANHVYNSIGEPDNPSILTQVLASISSLVRGETYYNVEFDLPNNDIRDKLYNAFHKQPPALSIRLKHGNLDPIGADDVSQDPNRLDVLFSVPREFRHKVVSIDFSVAEETVNGRSVTLQPAEITLDGNYASVTVALNDSTRAPQPPAGAETKPFDIAGTYQIDPGTSASWTGGTFCTGTKNYQFPPPATGAAVATVSAGDKTDQIILVMSNVDSRQLPKLRYGLSLLSNSVGDYLYRGSDALDTWGFACGTSSASVVPTINGVIDFKTDNQGVVHLTGTLTWGADIPLCPPIPCPASYRDIFTFSHIRVAK